MPRYAAHYLRLGAYRCPYPLVTDCGDGEVCLEPFVEEVAGTIFISGALHLVSDALPLAEEYEDISLEQARDLIGRYRDWKIILPH